MCWCRREEEFVANGRCERDNLDAVGLAQVLLCDRTGGDSSYAVSDAGWYTLGKHATHQ